MKASQGYLKILKSKLNRLKDIISSNHNHLRKDIEGDESMVSFLQDIIFKTKSTKSDFEKRIFLKNVYCSTRNLHKPPFPPRKVPQYMKKNLKIPLIGRATFSPKLTNRGKIVTSDSRIKSQGILSNPNLSDIDEELTDKQINDLKKFLRPSHTQKLGVRKSNAIKRRNTTDSNNTQSFVSRKRPPISQRVKGTFNSFIKESSNPNKETAKKMLNFSGKSGKFRYSTKDPVSSIKKLAFSPRNNTPNVTSLEKEQLNDLFGGPNEDSRNVNCSFIRSLDPPRKIFNKRKKKKQLEKLNRFINSPEEDDDSNYQRIFLTERGKKARDVYPGASNDRAMYKSGNLDDLKRQEAADWARMKRYSNADTKMRLPIKKKKKERQNSIVTKRRIRLDLLCKQLDQELSGALD